jgi:hypothetical protein
MLACAPHDIMLHARRAQMKKACITVREAQMRELEKKGDLPVVLLPQLGSRGSGSSGGGAPALPAASSSGSIARKAQQQRKYRSARGCMRHSGCLGGQGSAACWQATCQAGCLTRCLLLAPWRVISIRMPCSFV